MAQESQEHRRRRSNSQSQVSVSSFPGLPPAKSSLAAERQKPPRRHAAEYYVTLVSLNDTFSTKHIRVPYFPERCKLGRPTGTKVKPDSTNGYFDSRVLSRNHACMFINPLNGKLFIQDMGSSNGTFVNLEKISTEPVQIKIGDPISLGFNIQVETNHKQISARVEAINIMSNTPKSSVLSALPLLTQSTIDLFSDADMKHYEFMLKFLLQIFGDYAKPDAGAEAQTDPALTSVPAVIELAMFSDLIPVMDSTLYRQAPENAAFFENSNIAYSTELQTSLDHLTVNLTKIKQQNAALKSLETVLVNYAARVFELNSKFLQREMDKTERASSAAHKSLQAEAVRATKFAHDSERKLKDQLHLIVLLREETAKLRAERDALKAERYAAAEKIVSWQISPDKSPPIAPHPVQESPLSKTAAVSTSDPSFEGLEALGTLAVQNPEYLPAQSLPNAKLPKKQAGLKPLIDLKSLPRAESRPDLGSPRKTESLPAIALPSKPSLVTIHELHQILEASNRLEDLLSPELTLEKVAGPAAVHLFPTTHPRLESRPSTQLAVLKHPMFIGVAAAAVAGVVFQQCNK